MRILVISDTHGDLSAWNKVLERVGEGLDHIVHNGDVLHHGPKDPNDSNFNPSGLAEAINCCPYPMTMARGNCDSDEDDRALKWPLQDPFAIFQEGDSRLLATHGEKIPRSQFGDLAQKERPQVITFGHIHQPVLEREGKTLVLNPGSPTVSKYAPEGKIVCTAALISDGRVEVFDIDTGRAVLTTTIE